MDTCIRLLHVCEYDLRLKVIAQKRKKPDGILRQVVLGFVEEDVAATSFMASEVHHV